MNVTPSIQTAIDAQRAFATASDSTSSARLQTLTTGATEQSAAYADQESAALALRVAKTAALADWAQIPAEERAAFQAEARADRDLPLYSLVIDLNRSL